MAVLLCQLPKLSLLEKLDHEIVHLVLNYKEVVASNLLFLLGGACFDV